MLRKLLLAQAVLLLAVAGCAASQKMTYVAPVQDTEIFNAPFDKVWGATVATLAEDGMPIQSIEKESGIVTTQFVSFASGLFADKQIDAVAKRPSAFLGTWNAGRYTMSIYVSRVDSTTTRVKATPHIEGFENNVSKSWKVCTSNGSLEGKMFAGGGVPRRVEKGSGVVFRLLSNRSAGGPTYRRTTPCKNLSGTTSREK